jgi:hypothetical protein
MILRVLGTACIGLIGAACLGIAGLLAYWLSDREVPVETVQARVLTPIVEPGGKVQIEQTIRYTRECSAHIDRVLFDNHNHRKFLPGVDYERPPQGLGEFRIISVEDVPSYFDEGEANFRTIPIYHCNLVHRYFWPIAGPGTFLSFQVKQMTAPSP